MTSRLADHLSAARRRHFVGRTAERTLFESALTAAELPFVVLHLVGPGGIGKTTLLREFAALAEATGIPVIYLDARNFDPTPDAFREYLNSHRSPVEALAEHPGRQVVLLDTYELLAPLDNWLREVFLPQLPEQVLVVLASRQPLTAAWRADPGWQTLVRSLQMRNLSASESREYLTRRGVPDGQLDAVLSFTHGHPLALSLAAETFAQRQSMIFQPEAAPDMIKALLEQFVQKVPGPAHRAALEACALVRLTSEPLLGELLALPDPHDLFNWLRELSFIESGSQGLFPHDLAREALVTDLRWRHPDWYKELHRRARMFYVNHLGSGWHAEQQRLLLDLVFLHRGNPAVRPFFEWAESGSLLSDSLKEPDQPALLGMVARHEGEASARLAAHWLACQPEGFLIFRDVRQQPAGFMSLIALERATPQDLRDDPAASAVWSYLQRHVTLRPGERATLFRFWMADETYQAVSPVQSLVFIQAVNHYLTTPGLAYTFFPCAHAEFWAAVLAYADLARLAEADFEVGGRRYGVYGHDWRVMPPAAWLTLLGEREVGAGVQPAGSTPSAPVVVLSRPDFAAAVRDALHDFVRPDLLRGNPLAHSRLVLDGVGHSLATNGATEGTAVLQARIREAADALEASPRDAKLYRALYHTYFQPAPTQERAAEILDLPFSTYRRHLTAGIAHITEVLWQREVGETLKR
jgi:hypothetical protein